MCVRRVGNWGGPLHGSKRVKHMQQDWRDSLNGSGRLVSGPVGGEGHLFPAEWRRAYKWI